MIYFLRNISIRLWISVILAIPATFIMIPAIQRVMPDLSPAIYCIILIIVLFIIIGYVMNLAGERAIYRYINEAKNWERDGIFYRSGICYLKALELFDSYLLTTLTSRKTALPLTGAIARFALTASWHNDHFDKATTFFLLKNPHETEVAYLWLKTMVKQKRRTPLSCNEENLLTLLAEMEPITPQLVPMLAEIFTRTQRADFAAKRVFSIVHGDENSDGKWIHGAPREVESIEIPESSRNSQPTKVLEEPEEINQTRFNDIYQTQHPFAARDKRRRNIKVVKRPTPYDFPLSIQTALLRMLSLTASGAIWIASLPMNAISFIIRAIQLGVRTAVWSLKSIRNAIALYPELKRNIKRLVVLMVIAGVLMLLVNTVSRLFHTPSPPPPSTPKTVAENVEVQVVPQKKFTIQVAAYLSKSHAEQYLTNLKEKGVTGGVITTVEGGGKTWYLIRVGEYETKESATSYGNKLKSEGMVKDFFVDNSGV